MAIWAREGDELYFRILPDLGTHGIRQLPPPLVSRSWQSRECGGLGGGFFIPGQFWWEEWDRGRDCPRCHPGLISFISFLSYQHPGSYRVNGVNGVPDDCSAREATGGVTALKAFIAY